MKATQSTVRKTPKLASSLTVGLTGGIGSGKSTVAQVLVGLGAHLVDTDAIARALTLPGGTAIASLAAEFGNEAIDASGGLNREHMRRLAFSDGSAKARLEAILHPMIRIEGQARAEAADGRPVVFDVPLLAESRGPQAWRTRVQRILVVDCPEATQLERVLQRPGWTEDVARRVMGQQAQRAVRRAIADAVIFNHAITLQKLASEVSVLWRSWCGPLPVD